jgi:diguanylate cyclase (GGDEF)-like protein
VSSWERITSKYLSRLKLDQVRTKILAFAVLAILIPSVTTGWLSYLQSRRALTEKISSELVGVSSQAAHEVDLWLKERLYDLRVFANSYEVFENLARMPRGKVLPGAYASDRLGGYLSAVRQRVADYRELVVFDPNGRFVASSRTGKSSLTLPAGWEASIREDNPALGVPGWDSTAKSMVMVVAIPIRPPDGELVGALAAKLDLSETLQILRRFAAGHSGRAVLVTTTGRPIASSSWTALTWPMTARENKGVHALAGKPSSVQEYKDSDGVPVIGTLQLVPRSGWGVVAELAQSEGFGQVTRLRNLTILVVIVLLLVGGLLAYGLALLLIRPLDRLTQGAAKVAEGDFGVTIPVLTGGELGFLTQAFNQMVTRLREGRSELDATHDQLREKNAQLERLSLTDPLTGLYNRRQLMATLEGEVRRSIRTPRRFAVMMMDVDHFKTYNDAFGHQAGDEALMKVAAVLRSVVREVDCAARYGGEEFLALLPDTGIDAAVEVADRIRARLALESFTGGPITLSIGVAEFPTNGGSLESLIASADAALYHAKREGRDRIVRADRGNSAASPAAPSAEPTPQR